MAIDLPAWHLGRFQQKVNFICAGNAPVTKARIASLYGGVWRCLIQAPGFSDREITQMSQDIVEIANVTVAVLGATSCDFAVPTLANDLIGLAWEHEAEMVAVPVDCLPAEVFDLRSGLLGEIAQKAANYRVGMVIVGDVSGHVTASNAFHDYVYETNKGSTLWFVPDITALEARLVR
jgi:hypothetical protein